MLNAQTIVLIRNTSKYGVRLIKYTFYKYIKINFNEEKILSNTVNTSFGVD